MRGFRAGLIWRKRCIAEEICRIAFCDPADLFDQDGRLRQIKDLPPHVRAAVASVETVRGGGIKVKLWNKNNALDSLGRWRRMFVELQERGKPRAASPGRRSEKELLNPPSALVGTQLDSLPAGALGPK
jgi:hypothetical protein